MMEFLTELFDSPQWLLALPLVPLIAWRVARGERNRVATVRVPTASVLRRLPRGLAARLRRVPLIFRTIALALCVVGMARPQTFDPEELDVEGLDLIDGTPVLDIKPYIAHYDAVDDATIPRWAGGP